MIEIETRRLVLRPLGMQYLETVHEYASDIENTKYMVFLPNDTIEETIEFLQSVDKEWASEAQCSYEFAILFEDKQIGAVSVCVDENSTGELGWILHKNYWRQGFACEAAKALVEYARNELGVKHFIAHCDAENIGSYKTMEKLGMIRTAVNEGRKNKSSHEERLEYQYEMKC
ncbi:MAG: GNAT family N-acetyltransferase [Lachnospiraceae bacterium]|nr:GNAT family N-acetyltransferase [Lachnospiraceae bacterium]